ncbi:MAG: ribosome maturation factor RimM [Gammaproteobacteria bacterium]|nr:ribosome maturation factor RimM [Gammaproteobacteria bacterium]
MSKLSTVQHAAEQMLVGKITSAYGIKGWVKIYSHTSPIENIVSYLPWDLKRGSDRWQLDVLEARLHGKGLVARLATVDDRTAAEAMAGAEIYVDRSLLKELAEGEYYWDDLIGLDVTDTEGRYLGKVDSILETGANDVLEIVGEKRQLVPYVVGDVIKSIDIEAGVIQIDWVEPE